MLKKYHNNQRQPAQYYEQVLRILISCNADAMTYPQMAVALNAQNITSPTGLPFSGEIIKQLFKKLRAYKTYPSFIHQNLMELIFEGTLSVKETLPLFQSRRHGTM